MPRLDRGIQSAPPVKPGGDKKNAPWVKALWARYQTWPSEVKGCDGPRAEQARATLTARGNAEPWRRPGLMPLPSHVFEWPEANG